MLISASGYTQADLDNLRKAMLSGVRSISMGGRRKDFHSLAEQKTLYEAIAAELAAAKRRPFPRRRRSVMVVDA